MGGGRRREGGAPLGCYTRRSRAAMAATMPARSAHRRARWQRGRLRRAQLRQASRRISLPHSLGLAPPCRLCLRLAHAPRLEHRRTRAPCLPLRRQPARAASSTPAARLRPATASARWTRACARSSSPTCAELAKSGLDQALRPPRSRGAPPDPAGHVLPPPTAPLIPHLLYTCSLGGGRWKRYGAARGGAPEPGLWPLGPGSGLGLGSGLGPSSGRAPPSAPRWAVGDGRWAVGGGRCGRRWAVGGGRWAMGGGRWASG